MKLIADIRALLKKFSRYRKISKSDKIARRYFVMNGFDGALTMCGILVGSYFSGSYNPHLVISAGIGASIALGVSGFTSAFMAEEAERRRELKLLEQAMLTDLKDSIQRKAGEFATFYLAFIDGVSPLFFSLLILIPFGTISSDPENVELAYHVSFIINGIIFFFLGTYLGKISSEPYMKKGLQMLAIGLFTAGLVYFTSQIFG